MTATTTKIEVVGLDVPVVPGAMDGHVPRYLAGRLTVVQGRALKRLTVSLLAAHARLANGRHVEDNVGAIRWILERFEAGAVELGDGLGDG
jgi:hypothetical protein